MVRELVARAEWIGDDDVEIGSEERQVVVPAVPDEHVALALGQLQHGRVVDPRVDRHAEGDRLLVLLSLLDGGVRAVDVLEAGEALHAHRLEVAVRHRMAHEPDAVAGGGEEGADATARRALPAPGSHGRDRDDGLRGLEHRRVRAEEREVRTRGEHLRGPVHDVLVAQIRVGQDDRVDALLPNDLAELRLRPDRDARRVEPSGERRRVRPPVDPGDLRRGEGHDPHRVVFSEHGVEVVEVSSPGPHDHDPAHTPI